MGHHSWQHRDGIFVESRSRQVDFCRASSTLFNSGPRPVGGVEPEIFRESGFLSDGSCYFLDITYRSLDESFLFMLCFQETSALVRYLSIEVLMAPLLRLTCAELLSPAVDLFIHFA